MNSVMLAHLPPGYERRPDLAPGWVQGPDGQLRSEADLPQVARGRDAVASLVDPRSVGEDEPPSEASMSKGRRRLDVLDFAEVAARVEASGPRTWLVEGLWPADAYGVLGAEDKAGKTFALLDLAVSVATGSPWFNAFPCPTPGPVTLFLGEGGAAAMLRRLDAILASRGGDRSDLDGFLRLCFKAPRLSSMTDLEEIREELSAPPPRMVGLDPLYLSIAAGSGSDLYAMGDALYGIQELCQATQSALVVVTHWNKTGEGRGARRFTGVGPGAWGRILGSAAVEHRKVEEDGTTDVLLGWEFVGAEIPDRAFHVRRRVRAEDPQDLDSFLHYNVTVTYHPERSRSVSDLSWTQRRVQAALQALGAVDPEQGVTYGDIGDLLAGDGKGKPLKRSTIQKALEELTALDLTDVIRPGSGLPTRWWTT
jgi:AAA domain